MKKLIILSVFAIVVAGSIFAQEKAANARSNWASGDLYFPPGGGLKFERMLNGRLSLGANGYSIFVIDSSNVFTEMGFDAFARFYPWGKTFFAGTGLGYHAIEDRYAKINGAAITPEIGWKIDVGNVGKFFIQPGIKAPIIFGVRNDKDTGESKFVVETAVMLPHFGMGFAF